MDDRCAVPGCRAEVELVYLNHGICSSCWNRYTAESQSADALARALGISMAAVAAEEEIDMSNKKSKVENANETPKAVTAKASKVPTTKARKAPKPKNAQGLMVFAFRLSKAESEALHAAAGPANASRTMRALAAAFAAEDSDAFRAVVAEANKLRA